MSDNNQAALIQQQLFNLIKEKASSQTPLVEHIADVLKISSDAAYRRIRGEKFLSLDELLLLTQHFGVSIEQATSIEAKSLTASFNVRTINEHNFTYEQYLQSLVVYLQTIAQADDSNIIYSAKDIPIFYNFYSDELAIFKNFLWKKSLIGVKALEHEKFSLAHQGNMNELNYGREMLKLYCTVPSIEIWNEESILSVLRQIGFYYNAGLFIHPKEAFVLIDKVSELINHIEQQAIAGKKYLMGSTPQANGKGTYQLYVNELLINDNSSLVQMNGHKHVFITHNTINYIHIDNAIYCEDTTNWTNNLLKRSTLISTHSERLRREFFSKLTDKINAFKISLSQK